MCVYCNRSQKMSQRVKNSHTTPVDLVLYFFVLYTLAMTSSVIYYSTHTEKCYIFVKYSILINFFFFHCTYTFDSQGENLTPDKI